MKMIQQSQWISSDCLERKKEILLSYIHVDIIKLWKEKSCYHKENLITATYSLTLLYPPYPLPINPLPYFLASIRQIILTPSMLFSILPLSHILPSIWPTKCSYSMFLVILVLSFIYLTIIPLYSTFSMHLVMAPFSNVLSIIEPAVCSFYKLDKLPVPWI